MYENYYNKVKRCIREGRGNREEQWGRGREAPAKNLKKNEKGRTKLSFVPQP